MRGPWCSAWSVDLMVGGDCFVDGLRLIFCDFWYNLFGS